MVGLGTQDSFEMAQDFRQTYGTTSFQMLWDPSFDSWRELGITGQPAGLLVTRDGTLDGFWRGGIPEEQVLERIGEMA